MNWATFFLIFNLSLKAAELHIVGPCYKEPVHKILFNTQVKESVGAATIRLLNDFDIDYYGNERGIQSILKTPIGEDAIEVISESEFLAYGWCYSVNGFEPSTYPDEYQIQKHDTLKWWFGFAHYKDGQWITQCTPSHTRKSPQFCSK